MSAPVDVLSVKSFAGRAHARWTVVAGANPREKGIHDAAFGHYGLTVAKVSFEHEYSHAPELSAENAADYAERLVACADAMKGIADPRAFVAAVAELVAALGAGREVQTHNGSVLKFDELQSERLDAALRACGGAQ
jgi:hypothetical protein